MSLMLEYINKKMSPKAMEEELKTQIERYNRLRDTYLFVYAAAIEKQVPFIGLEQADYYVMRDVLQGKAGAKKIDVYIETPGGKGETAEEIVRYLRNNFESVSFVVSGEAKSAGTIIVLSGDEILLTETGSLGPIDAQIKIGRSVISAYDYMEWVDTKRKEAEASGSLNPFDATMIAQITPGELRGVDNSLEFAKDLVVDWLSNYKFKNWNVTEDRKIPVTEEMKKTRASEIASEFANHTKWRSHGRSIKIADLEEMKLKATRVDDNRELADVVYRIQTICRFLFNSGNTYKIFATSDHKIFRRGSPPGTPIAIPGLPPGMPIPVPPGFPKPPGTLPPGAASSVSELQQAEAVQVPQKCPQCGAVHNLYGKFVDKLEMDAQMKKDGFKPFPSSAILKCSCGCLMNLHGVRDKIEKDIGKKMLV